ncbi:hypothetical protein L2E82_49990 [Cichorium intybus]|nr:hypothetical protein L2E82_49990 [Cichorium intybus]
MMFTVVSSPITQLSSAGATPADDVYGGFVPNYSTIPPTAMMITPHLQNQQPATHPDNRQQDEKIPHVEFAAINHGRFFVNIGEQTSGVLINMDLMDNGTNALEMGIDKWHPNLLSILGTENHIFEETDNVISDVQVDLSISFMDAGCTKHLSFHANILCDSCPGKGWNCKLIPSILIESNTYNFCKLSLVKRPFVDPRKTEKQGLCQVRKKVNETSGQTQTISHDIQEEDQPSVVEYSNTMKVLFTYYLSLVFACYENVEGRPCVAMAAVELSKVCTLKYEKGMLNYGISMLQKGLQAYHIL